MYSVKYWQVALKQESRLLAQWHKCFLNVTAVLDVLQNLGRLKKHKESHETKTTKIIVRDFSWYQHMQ